MAGTTSSNPTTGSGPCTFTICSCYSANLKAARRPGDFKLRGPGTRPSWRHLPSNAAHSHPHRSHRGVCHRHRHRDHGAGNDRTTGAFAGFDMDCSARDRIGPIGIGHPPGDHVEPAEGARNDRQGSRRSDVSDDQATVTTPRRREREGAGPYRRPIRRAMPADTG